MISKLFNEIMVNMLDFPWVLHISVLVAQLSSANNNISIRDIHISLISYSLRHIL